jgi:hypothetical protein
MRGLVHTVERVDFGDGGLHIGLQGFVGHDDHVGRDRFLLFLLDAGGNADAVLAENRADGALSRDRCRAV